MLLAAGRGMRMRPLTDTTPKALIEVHGRPLLGRHLERLAAAGINEVVINLGWLGHRIRSFVGDGRAWDLRVRYSDEGDKILETGGGIHKALHLLGDEPFVVVNADILSDMPFPAELDDDSDAHLMLVPTPTYRPAGDFGLDGGRLTNAPDYTYAGVTLYRPSFFAGCEAGRFSVVPLWREAARDGRLSGSLYTGPWADVGTPERLAEINAAGDVSAQA